jgi:hypothetical protein
MMFVMSEEAIVKEDERVIISSEQMGKMVEISVEDGWHIAVPFKDGIQQGEFKMRKSEDGIQYMMTIPNDQIKLMLSDDSEVKRVGDVIEFVGESVVPLTFVVESDSAN